MKPERWGEIERLYHAALEREPASRAAFLDEACAGDAELRREAASLLAHDGGAAGFIEAPVLEVAARELAGESTSQAETEPPAAPARVGGYQILSLLGRGGMGEVHLALDARLGRKVALKLLPAGFTADAGRVRRFEQEARSASALNHPNILTIYEIGEAPAEDGGTHYIAAEYVEGETLRRRMAGAPDKKMEPAEALDVATQMAAALAAAHEAGIVHRDIKPENVMLRPDGLVKVLDFGLAKLAEPSVAHLDGQVPTVTGISTEPGVVMGTPSYMSPEQARGEKVDARADLFSLGVVLYEMVAGRAPFAGRTSGEVIAAILRDEPPPLALVAPDAPPELERVIGKALRKDRAERYQDTKDLLADLKGLRHRGEPETRVGETSSGVQPGGGDTRRRGIRPEGGTPRAARRRPAIFAAAALAIAALAGWFYLSPGPALTEKDTILLADFENRTGDEIFDVALKQGLAIQLQQSPFLSLFPETRVRQTLREMNRPPDARVTAQTAREICERHGLKALIAGSIAPLGSHYAITLEAINGQNGESLAQEQAEAEGKEQVLRALSQAATRLRGKLGESLGSIRQFDKPLEQATTSKLEAFKAWSLGIEHSYGGRVMEAIPLYRRAVELDPDFAQAYGVLSAVYWSTGRPGLAAEFAEKGYALKDRVNEYERLRITNFYHGFATGNLDKRIEVLKLLTQIYPRAANAGTHTDLSHTYAATGQYDEAVAEAREAMSINPNFYPPHRTLGWALLRLNRFAEARDSLTQSQEQKLDGPYSHVILYQIAFIEGDTAKMQAQDSWARGRPDEYLAFDWQIGGAAYAGRWRQAQALSRRAIELAAARDETQESAAQYAAEQALRGAAFGDCRRAGADAAHGLKLVRGRASLPRAALALALCGEADQAKHLADELIKLYPEDTIINGLWLPTIRAAAELRRGDAARAVEQLRTASRYEAAAEFWPQYLRGLALLKLGRGAEAGAEFRKILDHRGQGPLSVIYPLAHLGAARAAALGGDAAGSRRAYRDFLGAWKDADPDLPPMIEARGMAH